MENDVRERFEDMDKDMDMINVRLKEQEAINDESLNLNAILIKSVKELNEQSIHQTESLNNLQLYVTEMQRLINLMQNDISVIESTTGLIG